MVIWGSIGQDRDLEMLPRCLSGAILHWQKWGLHEICQRWLRHISDKFCIPFILISVFTSIIQSIQASSIVHCGQNDLHCLIKKAFQCSDFLIYICSWPAKTYIGYLMLAMTHIFLQCHCNKKGSGAVLSVSCMKPKVTLDLCDEFEVNTFGYCCPTFLDYKLMN